MDLIPKTETMMVTIKTFLWCELVLGNPILYLHDNRSGKVLDCTIGPTPSDVLNNRKENVHFQCD